MLQQGAIRGIKYGAVYGLIISFLSSGWFIAPIGIVYGAYFGFAAGILLGLLDTITLAHYTANRIGKLCSKSSSFHADLFAFLTRLVRILLTTVTGIVAIPIFFVLTGSVSTDILSPSNIEFVILPAVIASFASFKACDTLINTLTSVVSERA